MDDDHLKIDLSDLDLDFDINMSTLTIPSPAYTGNVTVSGTSGSNYTIATGASGYFYNTAGMNGSSWSTTSASSGGLTVKGDAEFEGDVKIQGHSILHILKKLEDRLAILQEPDPVKLEKYAALKKAYDHYKTLERLIGED